MPTPPIAAAILALSAVALVALGYAQAAACGGYSLVYFGLAALLSGGAFGVYGGFRTTGAASLLGVFLIVTGYLIGTGAGVGCWI